MGRTFTTLFFVLTTVFAMGGSSAGYGQAEGGEASGLADVTIDVPSSNIPRGTPSFFTASFKLQGISQKDYDDAQKNLQVLLEKHLQIQIDKHSENSDDDFAYILTFATSASATNARLGDPDQELQQDYQDHLVARYSNYVGAIPADAVIEKQDSTSKENLYRAEFTLTFLYRGSTDGADSPKGLMGTGSTIDIKVRYDEQSSKSFTINQSTAIANALPAFSLNKVHRGFVFRGDSSAATIPTIDGTEAGTPIKPDLVNIFAIKNTASTQTIPGKIYNKDPAQETAFDCTLTFTGDSSCQVTCSDQANVYVNKTDLPDTWLHKSQSYGKSSEFSKDLEVGAVYGVFATYEPDGIIWRSGEEASNCKAITIKENKTMIELETGKSSVLGNPDCFIATAAYGSVWHPHLNELRWFRDHILMGFSAGRAFVSWYYRHGPKAAAVIAQQPTLRTITQAALMPLVALAALSHHYPLALFALLLALAAFALRFATRRYT